MSGRLPWWEEALCRKRESRVFLAVGGPDVARAKAVCAACPVAGECLELAMRLEDGDHTRRAGVYGGLSPRQRAVLAKQRRSRVARG